MFDVVKRLSVLVGAVDSVSSLLSVSPVTALGKPCVLRWTLFPTVVVSSLISSYGFRSSILVCFTGLVAWPRRLEIAGRNVMGFIRNYLVYNVLIST